MSDLSTRIVKISQYNPPKCTKAATNGPPPEGQAVAEAPVGESPQHHVNHVLHHDVGFVLHGHAAALQHSETLEITARFIT